MVASPRHRGHDAEVVVRWVERRPSSFGTMSSRADVVRLDAQLVGIGAVRIDAPFTPASVRAVDGWRAPGRLLPSRVWPARPFRIVVEIAPWSRTEMEVRIAPRSRRALRRWGEWRRRRYWGLAHDVADQLARELSPEVEPSDVHRRGGDASRRSGWDDTSQAPVHPLFLPAEPDGARREPHDRHRGSNRP